MQLYLLIFIRVTGFIISALRLTQYSAVVSPRACELFQRSQNKMKRTQKKGNGNKIIYLDDSSGSESSQEQKGIIKKGRMLEHAEFNSACSSILAFPKILISREEK